MHPVKYQKFLLNKYLGIKVFQRILVLGDRVLIMKENTKDQFCGICMQFEKRLVNNNFMAFFILF